MTHTYKRRASNLRRLPELQRDSPHGVTTRRLTFPTRQLHQKVHNLALDPRGKQVVNRGVTIEDLEQIILEIGER